VTVVGRRQVLKLNKPRNLAEEHRSSLAADCGAGHQSESVAMFRLWYAPTCVLSVLQSLAGAVQVGRCSAPSTHDTCIVSHASMLLYCMTDYSSPQIEDDVLAQSCNVYAALPSKMFWAVR
jgi:hypothetical protein